MPLVIPAMPVVFVPVWLLGFVLFGVIGWRTQTEGWFLVAFAWLLLVGPVCWILLGAADS